MDAYQKHIFRKIIGHIVFSPYTLLGAIVGLVGLTFFVLMVLGLLVKEKVVGAAYNNPGQATAFPFL